MNLPVLTTAEPLHPQGVGAAIAPRVMGDEIPRLGRSAAHLAPVGLEQLPSSERTSERDLGGSSVSIERVGRSDAQISERAPAAEALVAA